MDVPQMSPPQKAAVVGLVLGIVAFINLPSFTTFAMSTAITAGTFSGIGLLSRVGWKKTLAALTVIPLLLFIGIIMFNLGHCPAIGVTHGPAKNPVTGELSTERYDGFRAQFCDKGAWPWYYEELDQSEFQSEINRYCNDHPQTRYCMLNCNPSC